MSNYGTLVEKNNLIAISAVLILSLCVLCGPAFVENRNLEGVQYLSQYTQRGWAETTHEPPMPRHARILTLCVFTLLYSSVMYVRTRFSYPYLTIIAIVSLILTVIWFVRIASGVHASLDDYTVGVPVLYSVCMFALVLTSPALKWWLRDPIKKHDN